MLTAVEAVLDSGRVVPVHGEHLPEHGRVLLVILSGGDASRRNRAWDCVRQNAGALQIREDPVAWQRRVRDEW